MQSMGNSNCQSKNSIKHRSATEKQYRPLKSTRFDFQTSDCVDDERRFWRKKIPFWFLFSMFIHDFTHWVDRFEKLGLICLYIDVSVVRCHTRSKLLIHVGYIFIVFKQIWLMTLLQDEVIKIHSNVLSEKIIVKFTIITKNNSFMPFSTSYIGDLSLLLLHPFTITMNTNNLHFLHTKIQPNNKYHNN